ncbi:hypothetical protein ACVXZZ_06800 [Staphylococcus aureus]
MYPIKNLEDLYQQRGLSR